MSIYFVVIIKVSIQIQSTPAFIFDASKITHNASVFNNICNENSITPLYSLKSLSLIRALELIKHYVNGFAASSYYEARLAREILQDAGTIHFHSPGIRPDEIDILCKLSDYFTVNSISQWIKYKERLLKATSPGIRINPNLSFVDDHRYDPCAENSKLGINLDYLKSIVEKDKAIFDGIEGIHFHSNCESYNFNDLLSTIHYLIESIHPLLEKVHWINIGGGYYFDEGVDLEPLKQSISLLKLKYDVEIFSEPGSAIVQNAGTLTTQVIDIIDSQSKKIAILDTTVNHLPEVFEYQYEPKLFESANNGTHEYTVAGCSCLSGDMFGHYKFNSPLEIGNRVSFIDVGAYTFVKAHHFNGINLPSVYLKHSNSELELMNSFNYQDFINMNRDLNNESLRKRA